MLSLLFFNSYAIKKQQNESIIIITYPAYTSIIMQYVMIVYAVKFLLHIYMTYVNTVYIRYT